MAFVGAFAAQVARRVQLLSWPRRFSLADPGSSHAGFWSTSWCRCGTIRERPIVGFAQRSCSRGSSRSAATRSSNSCSGLGIVDLPQARWFRFRVVLSPFASAVLGGILFLLVRRAFVRPSALGTKVSMESIVIALFIATLMVTFLLAFAPRRGDTAGRVNWWIHMLVILAFLALIPASKHFHLVLSPFTVFLKSPELAICRTWISRRNRSASRR